MTTTGRELRLERLSADITIVDLAARMGLTRQTVWAIELSAVVRNERANLYRRALLDAIEASR